MKTNLIHADRTFPTSNRKILERDNIDTPSTRHDHWISWLGTGTSIKSGGAKIILWVKVPLLSKRTRSCKCFPHVSKMNISSQYNFQYFNSTPPAPSV